MKNDRNYVRETTVLFLPYIRPNVNSLSVRPLEKVGVLNTDIFLLSLFNVHKYKEGYN